MVNSVQNEPLWLV